MAVENGSSPRFFHFPGSCSLASHIALEEAGLPYTPVRVDLRAGAQHAEAYRAINPLGRVPALEVEDGLLTENVAILSYVSDRVPERGLLPAAGTLERIRAIEWLAFLASVVHPAFRAISRPDRFLAGPDSLSLDEVRGRGIANAAEAMKVAETRLGGRPNALGAHFSLCDAYLFVFFQWSHLPHIRPGMPSLPGLEALGARVEARPAVRRVLEA